MVKVCIIPIGYHGITDTAGAEIDTSECQVVLSVTTHPVITTVFYIHRFQSTLKHNTWAGQIHGIGVP